MKAKMYNIKISTKRNTKRGIDWWTNHSPSTYYLEVLLGKENKKIWVSEKFVKTFEILRG
jgi:hypothetical protein